MGNYLNIGNAGFTSTVKDIYVDKTGMIAFINDTLGKKRKLTCVSRPRRFGKSFAAQMLCAYYDKSCDSHALFEGLEISKDPTFETHLNRYDVIYLDITEFTSDAFIKKEMQNVVINLENKVISELAAAYPNVTRQNDLPGMLYNITEATGNQFIFIIDEWDALFREEKDDTALHEAYIKLLRGLFKNSGKTDKMIAAAYMTGILPIKKYGSQSAVSDFREYTMLSPGALAKYMGFTEPEVKALCNEYGMDFEKMKYWYDGYSFSRLKSVYNPNSVMEAINRQEFGSYWTRTETYEALKIYIDMDEDGLKEAITQMLGGECVKIMSESFQNDMTSIRSKDDVLTLLVHLGYLAYDAKKECVFIPNEEVKKEFLLAVAKGKHTELARLIQNSDFLLEQTLNMNEAAVAAAIEESHKLNASPIKYNNEECLRSTIRLAYISCRDEFMEIDELPSGHGYVDMAFVPKKGSSKPVILIELKWNKTSDGAILQMKERDYAHILRDYGSDILLVGINYDEKTKRHTCKIERNAPGEIPAGIHFL